MWILRFLKALQKKKVDYAIAGGYAVALHGAIRGTFDLDLLVRLDLKSLQKMESALQSMGLRSRIPVTAKEVSQFRKEYIEKRNLIAWNFFDPNNALHQVDILLIEDLKGKKVDQVRVKGETIHLLSKQDLIKMKKSSGRKQDLEDVRVLENL